MNRLGIMLTKKAENLVESFRHRSRTWYRAVANQWSAIAGDRRVGQAVTLEKASKGKEIFAVGYRWIGVGFE